MSYMLYIIIVRNYHVVMINHYIGNISLDMNGIGMS